MNKLPQVLGMVQIFEVVGDEFQLKNRNWNEMKEIK